MKRVLIVDDNKYILDGLAMTFSRAIKDIAVLTAENGEKAFEVIGSSHVDAIITDLAMPVMDGYRLIQEVRKRFSDIPIFVMTADCGPEISERLAPFGVIRCFEKPFDYLEAARALFEALTAEGASMSGDMQGPTWQLVWGEEQAHTSQGGGSWNGRFSIS